MQPIPRLLVNLPVISVKILVNLLVKLTKLGRSIFDDLRPWSSWRPSPGVLVETGPAGSPSDLYIATVLRACY